MADRFYMACLRDTVGTSVSFHGASSAYHTDVQKAREYTKQEAQRAWNSAREIDLPLDADKIDQMTVLKVDCQLLPTDSMVVPGCNEYVAFKRGRWNGNDVYWLTDGHGTSDDFSLATIFPGPVESESVISLPLSYADERKRKTFNVGLINRRSMVQGAGLVTPEHIKKYMRRNQSCKTRFNCPGCGKIRWQHNPHDFEGCTDSFCIEYRPSLS